LRILLPASCLLATGPGLSRFPDCVSLPSRRDLVPARGCTLVNEDRVALVQQVKAANDIVEVVGGEVSLRQAGAIYKGLCPFHNDKNPSLTVDPRRQRYKCWACGKGGDVITFIQEIERVEFREALESLARRAGITLEKNRNSLQEPSRALMLDVVRWAAEQFQQCLLDAPQAEAARIYLGQRKLTGDTVRKFGLGFAPPQGDWLIGLARKAGLSFDILEKVGLIAKNDEGRGYYGRFRDRVMFPIRNQRGQTVGFGGRILPSSPLSARAPKYYNSSETVLFSKSDQLYGIDHARQPAAKAGYLAVVEGYTDVLMAHQAGVSHVVATMGTALNVRHVHKLRGVVPRVVLVFDADAGGDSGVDRALEVFVRADMELRVASLPEGLDPCDLLVQQGPEPFVKALEAAVDVFEYKLQQVFAAAEKTGIDGQQKAVEDMLAVLALASDLRTVKMELMVNRMAHRLHLKEETLWTRLRELHAKNRQGGEPIRPLAGAAAGAAAPAEEERKARPAARHEQELIEVLLAEPGLVAKARPCIAVDEVEHPGLRQLLAAMYALQDEGRSPDLDHLRESVDNERLLAKALDLQDRGLALPERQRSLQEVAARFAEKRTQRLSHAVKNQLHAADHETAVALLRQLQNQTRG